MKVRIPNNWQPRDYQIPLWVYMESGGAFPRDKRAVELAHRRWGKDDVALHFTATQAVRYPATYWHMLPKYNQCRKVVWNAVNPITGLRRIDEAFPKEIRKSTNSQEMYIEFLNGATWQLVGSDNYDSIVGSPPLGIVLSEWALANPMAWGYLAPILEENHGWALFIYTSRGNNHGAELFRYAEEMEGWFSQWSSAKTTGVFGQEQLDRIKQEYIRIYGRDLGVALFEQEYLCSLQGAVLGAYWGEQMSNARDEGRITKVSYKPGLEVDTFWDLGVDDATAIWFMQPVGKDFHFIDYYESVGKGMEHYSRVLKEKGYTYGNHWMPHDSQYRRMTSGEEAKTPKQMAENLGIKPVIPIQRARNMDVIVKQHIPAARNMLPRCWFDEDKCRDGIAALENFRAEYDEEKKVLSNRYLHDWSSHAATAFLTFAVGYWDRSRKTESPKVKDINVFKKAMGE